VLLTDSILDQDRAYFLSYSISGRLKKKIVIDRELYDSLVKSFGKALPELRQKRLGALIVPCGQPVEIKSRFQKEGEPTDRRVCLDGATQKEQAAVGQWWLNIRNLLRL
jgi:hypothetical protein